MNKNNEKAGAPQGGKPEEVKILEIGKNLPAVQAKAMELPIVIKTVEELFKKIQHRDKLESYTQQLSDFVINKTDEDLEPTSYFVGCRLEITDDANAKFQLKHPVVIKEVIEFIKGRFTVKLAEIEKQIKLPVNQAA